MDPTLPPARSPAPPAKRASEGQARREGPAPIGGPKPLSRVATASAGLLGSFLLHAGLALLIVLAATLPQALVPQVPIEIDVMEKEPPPPPPPPAPEPPKPPEPKKAEPPKIARVVKPKPNQPPPAPVPKDAPPPPPDLKEDLPPPPNDAPPPGAKPGAPLMIGISMSSTSTAGSFAAPVGNTLYGNAPTVAAAPEEVKPYASPTGRYVPPYKVTRLPELVKEVKARYPEEARKLGIEGQVVLRLTIDGTGKVIKAKVIKSAGQGFDEAALSAVKQFGFKPGTEGGEAVTTEITYTYTFLLD